MIASMKFLWRRPTSYFTAVVPLMKLTAQDSTITHEWIGNYWEKYKDEIIRIFACMSGLVPKGVESGDYSALHSKIATSSEISSLLNFTLTGVWPIVANDAHYPSPGRSMMSMSLWW